jgi:hypothetical protein
MSGYRRGSDCIGNIELLATSNSSAIAVLLNLQFTTARNNVFL